MTYENLLNFLSKKSASIGLYALTSNPRDRNIALQRIKLQNEAQPTVEANLRESVRSALGKAERESKLSDFSSHDSASTIWSVQTASELAVGASQALMEGNLSSNITNMSISEATLKAVKGLLVSFTYLVSDQSSGETTPVKIRAYFHYYGGAVLSPHKYLKIYGTDTLTKASTPVFKLPTAMILVGSGAEFYVCDLKKYEAKFGFDDAVNALVRSSLATLQSEGFIESSKPFVGLVRNKKAFKKRIISAAKAIRDCEITLSELIGKYNHDDYSQRGLLNFDDHECPSRIVIETQNDAANFCDFCNTDISVHRLTDQKSRILSKKNL